MPTGYTCFIEDGRITTGKEFLKKCIREFGCCIDQRDDPLSAELNTEVKENPYYHICYENALKSYESLKNMTIKDLLKEARVDRALCIKHKKEYIKKQRELREKYLKIRREIESWIPPTSKHYSIKEFALEQIDKSIPKEDIIEKIEKEISELECDDESALIEDVIAIIKCTAQDVEYYKTKIESRESLANERNEFLKTFLDSLEEE